jgi:2,3-bisphosphoglycerate-independent phosphoglycerate mutase
VGPKRPRLPDFTDRFGVRGCRRPSTRAYLGVLSGIGCSTPGATAGFDNDYVAQRGAALASLATVTSSSSTWSPRAGGRGVPSTRRSHRSNAGTPTSSVRWSPHWATSRSAFLLPDHATPCAARTRTSEPVPYLLFDATSPVPAASTERRRQLDQCPPTARWRRR